MRNFATSSGISVELRSVVGPRRTGFRKPRGNPPSERGVEVCLDGLVGDARSEMTAIGDAERGSGVRAKSRPAANYRDQADDFYTSQPSVTCSAPS